MPKGTSRSSSLKPQRFLEFVEKTVKEIINEDEVFVRRLMSSVFFALYNYWAAKQWDAGRRCKGPKQDRFPYTLFVKDMLNKGLDRSIFFIYLCRTAADHYILNPTVIGIWDKNLCNIFGEEFPVSLSSHDLPAILKAAKEILNNI